MKLKELHESLDDKDMKFFEPADFASDEEDQEPEGFKQEPVFIQLGKILDSSDTPKPITSVTTDDGKEHTVSPDQARVLRMLATTDKVKPSVRDAFVKDIQTTNGLVDFLDIKDSNEMAQLFVKKYLG